MCRRLVVTCENEGYGQERNEGVGGVCGKKVKGRRI